MSNGFQILFDVIVFVVIAFVVWLRFYLCVSCYFLINNVVCNWFCNCLPSVEGVKRHSGGEFAHHQGL